MQKVHQTTRPSPNLRYFLQNQLKFVEGGFCGWGCKGKLQRKNGAVLEQKEGKMEGGQMERGGRWVVGVDKKVKKDWPDPYLLHFVVKL
ncbi:hypothetical protein D8674_005799 [Pyrus ussuriensis x Pyrus communis]|uniref:Uncharacterized protein n=1 Tax=Pyrus ussuriensis x Pyrus communis TaxID=2448454 RepID=A0A5N5FY53_9ROSA|nr:hypothetical protein D8674_005799 [Pyrus ussuriensis x Pyrus communis]